MKAADVIKMAKANGVKMVDLKFTDFIGTWQHFSAPVSQLSEEMLENGLMFDGSSCRAWQTIDNSDMKIVPELATAKMDPFTKLPTLSLICNIMDPITGENYTRDPRNIAKKAENYLKQTGIGDTIFCGPEAEFFMFDDVRYDYSAGESFYSLYSSESPWATGADETPNLAYKIRPKSGYFPCAPSDSQQDIRDAMVMELQNVGLTIEASHHEVAPAQHEIDMKFDTLLGAADNLQWYYYVVKNVGRAHGKAVTFMPKPVFADNGSGMHTHQSIWKDGKPLFAGDQVGGLSEMAIFYIGGILKHARALAAFTNPSTNSYKRLVPGYEAPINLAYSNRNRSACVRIPVVDNDKARRIEYRCPDSTSNPFLAFSAMMMAGLDGIQNKIHPGEPMDVNIYDLPPEELTKMGHMPANLKESLDALRDDHEFLLKGDVFTQDVIDYWIDYKMEEEVKALDSRPHPYEFDLYFDI